MKPEISLYLSDHLTHMQGSTLRPYRVRLNFTYLQLEKRESQICDKVSKEK